MGTSYIWANPRKREFLNDTPFDDCGFMMSCSSYDGSTTTAAAATLISSRWHGDPVVFASEHLTNEEGAPWQARLFKANAFDEILTDFRDVTGLFEQARGFRTEDCIDVEGDYIEGALYDGPFTLAPERRRYYVNRTRMEYVDTRSCPPDSIYVDGGGYGYTRIDPLPLLFAPGFAEDKWEGRWCADAVAMESDNPGAGFADVTVEVCSAGYCCEAPYPIRDAELRNLLCSREFSDEIEKQGIAPYGKSIELKGAIPIVANTWLKSR